MSKFCLVDFDIQSVVYQSTTINVQLLLLLLLH